MKRPIAMIGLLITIWVSLLCVAPSFGQTVEVCGPDKGLSWEANTEPDIKNYLVYAAPMLTQEYQVVATVAHDPSKIITLPDGTQTIPGGMAKIPDGLTEFYVTAVDTSGNESDQSNHVVCDVKIPPGSPTGLTVTIQLVNP